MQEFFPFFIILLVAVVFSQLFLRMRIPWVVALIIGGMIVGPNGLGWFEPNTTIDFLATIGLVFLMFMAGLESKLSEMKGIKAKIAVVGGLVGLLPTAVGIAVTLSFGYEITTALLMGIIFMSSAIALLVPTLQEHKIIEADLGKVIIAGAIIIDAISLLLLSVFLQFVTAEAGTLGSLLIYPFAFLILGLFAWALPKMRWVALSQLDDDKDDMFERELRFTVMILIGLVVFFEFVGLHAIIAGFFAGMILSKSMSNSLLKAKLHAISYGFFVPVFFVVVGATTDLSVFFEGLDALLIMAAIVGSLVASKFVAGYVGGRLSGFSHRQSEFIGFAVMPQLSTALAVAFLGYGAGILDQALLSSIVGLAIVTSIVSPVFVNLLGRKIVIQKPEPSAEEIPETVLAGEKQAPTTVTDRPIEEATGDEETDSRQ
jgi:Kef-type K+ transport system membrane component KefB